jgi:hypothetical protein
MKVTNKSKAQETNLNNNLDALCQEFDGGSFYGLEYILEDFFTNTTVKSSAPSVPPVDWFGLYD